MAQQALQLSQAALEQHGSVGLQRHATYISISSRSSVRCAECLAEHVALFRHVSLARSQRCSCGQAEQCKLAPIRHNVPDVHLWKHALSGLVASQREQIAIASLCHDEPCACFPACNASCMHSDSRSRSGVYITAVVGQKLRRQQQTLHLT